jgi:hypothetical protein
MHDAQRVRYQLMLRTELPSTCRYLRHESVSVKVRQLAYAPERRSAVPASRLARSPAHTGPSIDRCPEHDYRVLRPVRSAFRTCLTSRLLSK